jgi:hypothetical protein
MENRGRVLLIVLAGLDCALFGGCQQRLGDFTVLSTKNVDLTRFNTEQAENAQPVTGEDSKPIIGVFNTGLPNVKEAADRALESANAHMLTNAVIYYTSWYIPYVYGDQKYEVKGNPVKR